LQELYSNSQGNGTYFHVPRNYQVLENFFSSKYTACKGILMPKKVNADALTPLDKMIEIGLLLNQSRVNLEIRWFRDWLYGVSLKTRLFQNRRVLKRFKRQNFPGELLCPAGLTC
jgi:hypothetical protein